MNGTIFSSDFIQIGPNLTKAIIKVPAQLVNKFYKHALKHYAKSNTIGFSKGCTPISYVEQNFSQNILKHLKEFFLKYSAISFLYQELRRKKIAMTGEPRLIDSFAHPERDAEYHFEINTIQYPIGKDWKYISFRPPKRKGYKGIDKQVFDFLQAERERTINYKENGVEVGDWVNFSLYLVDEEANPVLENLNENYWLRIGSEEISAPFQELFLGKKNGDKFLTKHICLQDFFNTEIETHYSYLVEILDVIHQSYFSMDSFKEHFKIKTNKKAHQKIVEIFSFKDDLSLRRAIITGAFNTLFHSYKIEAPTPSILRQQQILLDHLQYNPDYPVYKTEPGFNEKVKDLAIRQIKEMALMELLAYFEDIQIEENDVRNYLNLTQRMRTKDFVHFIHPAILSNNDEYPLISEPLKQICLREKALNHAIFYLTKE